MRFTKMNGAGNDFILVENLHGELTQQQLSKLARTLCDRRMSIGADGLMAIVPAKADADFGMLFFNCDGTLGEMCGNGARCICRYGYETGLAGETQTIETTAGLVTGTRIDAKNYRIRLPDPMNLQYLALDVDGKKVGCMYLELGNPGIPHAVVQIAAVRSAINNIGKVILQDHIQHCIVDAVERDDEQALDSLCQAIEKFIK